MRKRIISGGNTSKGNPYLSNIGGIGRSNTDGGCNGANGYGGAGIVTGNGGTGRYVNYDMLRIVAAWLIIVLHLSAGYGCFGVLPALSRIGVPIFIMITGTFLLNPDKDLQISLIFTRYLPKIILIFLGWSAFYAFYGQGVFDGLGLCGGDALREQLALAGQLPGGGTAAGAANVAAATSIDWDLFWQTLVAGHYHMWYLYMLMGLYLITPFLRCITEVGERTIIAYFLTLCVIITSITKLNDAIWHLDLLDVALDKLALTFIFGYVGYYIAGHYYDHYALFPIERGALYIAGLGALAFTVWYTLQTGSAETMAAANVLYSNYSPTVFIMSFAVFASCAAWRRHSFGRRWSRFVGIFPKYMLAVYLVHPFVINELGSRLLLKGTLIADAYAVAPSRIGSLYEGISGTIESTLAIDAVIVFAVSLLISIILMQLWFTLKKITKIFK